MKRNVHFFIRLKTLSLSLLLIFCLASTSQAQEEINVVGGLQTILDGTLTTSLLDRTDFDFAIIGGGMVSRTFTIENLGTAPLTITNITGTGDFATIGALTPVSPIPAGQSATFTVTFAPTALGLQTGTISILNSDSDEGLYDFAVQGLGSNTAIGTWNPILYPPSPCSWTSQDANTTTSPLASWSQLVLQAEAGSTNQVITLQPDAYLGSFDYDNNNGNESCNGHQVAATLDLNAAQNGMEIIGSTNGCVTFIDLSSGSGSNQWGNFTNMNGLTIRSLYLRQWGGAINLTNCSNVLIEDCVFENSNLSTVQAVLLSNCTNVTFRRCSFLGNVNPSGRAIGITNSGSLANRILFEDCDFGCNSNGGSGAALMVGAGSFVQINGGDFSGNNSGAGGRGGAINVQRGADLVISGTNFMRNQSPGTGSSVDGGGAVFVDGASTTLQTNVLIDNCNFFQNTASATARGGAIVCIGNSSAISRSNTIIQNSRFEMNGGARGGAVMGLNCTATFNNNVFLNNQSAALTDSPNSRGGALHFQNSSGVYTITNNTFTNNLGPSSTRAINDDATGSTFVFTDNFLNPAVPVQTEDLPINNSIGTAGSTITLTSLSAVAADFDCSSGAYCAITMPGSCLANAQSDFICGPDPGTSGSIAGQVWDDADGNGIQAPGDLGIAGVYVLLYDEMGYVVGNTTTDANGNYSFAGLPPGNYSVVVVNPNTTSYTFVSPANASGSTESTDSDQAFAMYIGADLRGATVEFINVVAGGNVADVDVGFTAIDLPIELISFDVQNQSCNSNHLTWLTATELNNEFFSIERSIDGMNFETLALVNSQGNSTDIQKYEWEDKTILQKAYYRLKQTDFDGSFSYSNLVYLESTCGSFSPTVYPNPANESLTVSLTAKKAGMWNVEVINTLGQSVFNQKYSVSMGTSTINLSTSKLAVGTYFVRLSDGEKATFSNKVQIQH